MARLLWRVWCRVAWLYLTHFRSRRHDGTHDFVISGAAAQIAGKPVPHLGFGRIGVAVEQRLGRHQESRRADAALQGRMGDEVALQGMKHLALGHALDRADALALGFRAEHQAGADEPVVQHHAACPAVARAAAFLGTGKAEPVAQHVEQRLVPIAEIFNRIAVDGRRHPHLTHDFLLARLSAIFAARLASTPATLILYSLVPRLSSMGRQAADAAAASLSSALSSTLLPMRAFAAS